MNNISEQIEALIRFKNAYCHLSVVWSGRNDGINLNDTRAIEDYPFHRSLDDLDVIGWVNETVKELKAKTTIRDESGISSTELNQLQKIVHRLKDDIDFLSVEEVEKLQTSLKCLAYTKAIKAFHQHLLDSMPNLPNDTPEDPYDLAWEKFYETPFTISFGGKSITIDNEATIYQGIVDTLEDMIDYCL